MRLLKAWICGALRGAGSRVLLTVADNGYALGTHRRQPGKTLSFEEDIHVPFIARGPGIPHATDTVASYGIVDLSRTILDIAGAKADYEDDGVRIDLHQPKIDDLMEARDGEARHSLTEYWVLGGGEGIYGGPLRTNNSESVAKEGTRTGADTSVPHRPRLGPSRRQDPILLVQRMVHGRAGALRP